MIDHMSSSSFVKSRSGSSHGPASSISTRAPRWASSLATTGPPAPAPTMMTSGRRSTISSVLGGASDALPVLGVAQRWPPVADLGPGPRRVEGPALPVVSGPLRVEAPVGEHQQGVHDVLHVGAL